jgi:predicted P-loop ATPase
MNKTATLPKNSLKKLSQQSKDEDLGKTIPLPEDDNLSEWQLNENFINHHFDIQYNKVSNQVEYREDNKDGFTELKIENLFRYMKIHKRSISITNLQAMLSSDFVKIVDPFIDYFNSLIPWRQEDPDYIESLANYVKIKNIEDQPEFNHHFKKMLVRCIKCAIEDAYFNKHALILVGPTQNTGKSTFIRFLCPEKLKNYFSESFIFNDKDNLIGLSENFIINIDELAALNKIEINSLKSYFSKDRIKIRHPYGKKQITTPRRVNFFGSTNKSEFLGDETGSVRWLCFEIEKIDYLNQEKGNYKDKISIDQVWAQAYYLFKNGFKYDLTAEETTRNEIRNKAYQHTTVEIELIQKHFMPGNAMDNTDFFTATEIGEELKSRSRFSDYKMNIIAIGKALAYLKFEKQCIRQNTDTTKKGYFVKYERNVIQSNNEEKNDQKKGDLPF